MLANFTSTLGDIKKSDWSSVKYIWVDYDYETSVWTLFASANSDFISFMHLYKSWLIMTNTYAWIAMHSIEKYLKAIIMLYNKDITWEELQNKFWHSLLKLWKEYKKLTNIEYSYYDEFVNEINNIKDWARYWEMAIMVNDGKFIGIFVYLTTLLRCVIEYKNYDKSFYWIKGNYFTSNFYNWISDQTQIIKLIHLIIEHNIIITTTGMIDWFRDPPNTENLKQKHSQINLICPFCEWKIIIPNNEIHLHQSGIFDYMKKYFSLDIDVFKF